MPVNTTRRSHSVAMAPKTATGVLSRTLKGSDQLSYRAARIRNTKTSEAAKIVQVGMPCCDFCSW